MAFMLALRAVSSLALGLAAGFALSACQAVQPWEKGTLGRDTMRPDGAVAALAKIDTHVYYSKEGVNGGKGVGGGGCGCN